MSKTVGLRDELYEKLEELATAQKLTVEQIIENLVREVEAAHLSATLERMRAEGLLAERRHPAEAISVGFKRIKVSGKPVSETIIEERG